MSATVSVLGVRVDWVSIADAVECVRGFLRGSGLKTIFTPNPEMLVKAQHDVIFKNVLNSGSLNLCDGRGLALVAGVSRITGTDFLWEVCKVAHEEGKSVFLLGSGSSEVVRAVAERLSCAIPGLVVSGMNKGAQITELPTGELQYDATENAQIIAEINASGTAVLFVAFDAGKQEKWIAESAPQLPGVRVAMGVGGAFDYISGKVKRAPCFLRYLGLEWMYRLVRQPRRFRRIVRAVIVFPWLVLRDKFVGRTAY